MSTEPLAELDYDPAEEVDHAADGAIAGLAPGGATLWVNGRPVAPADVEVAPIARNATVDAFWAREQAARAAKEAAAQRRLALTLPPPEVAATALARADLTERGATAAGQLWDAAAAAGWSVSASYVRGPLSTEKTLCPACLTWQKITKADVIGIHGPRDERCSRTALDPESPAYQVVDSIVVRATSPARPDRLGGGVHRLAATWIDDGDDPGKPQYAAAGAKLWHPGDRARDVEVVAVRSVLKTIGAGRKAERKTAPVPRKPAGAQKADGVAVEAPPGPVVSDVPPDTTEPVVAVLAPAAVPVEPAPVAELAPVHADGRITLLHGDCLEVLRTLPDASVDAVVTDPPYGLAELKPATVSAALLAWLSGDRDHVPDGKGFMGRAWDGFVPPPAVWDECLRVLKPGGHLLAFAGSRTADLMGISVRLAGFEIRDEISCWLYGSGFPKSTSQLKPAHEPIIVARKPLIGSVVANVSAHGTGALNIEDCRVRTANATDDAAYRAKCASVVGLDSNRTGDAYGEWSGAREDSASDSGRWPSNVVLCHSEDCGPDDTTPCVEGCPVAELDAQSGNRPGHRSQNLISQKPKFVGGVNLAGDVAENRTRIEGYNDEGGASRFFPTFRYQAKAPARERPCVNGIKHNTVKPLELIKWLVRLVTPAGGTVLEPFAGSGTTVEAALREGFGCIAVEREADYLPLIVERILRSTPDPDVAA